MPKNQTSCDDEFRSDAVDLFASSSKSYTEIADGIGILPSTLKAWVRKFLAESGDEDGAAGTVRDAASREELAAQIHSPHKELEHVKRQRDILKRATAILAKDPRPGMS